MRVSVVAIGLLCAACGRVGFDDGVAGVGGIGNGTGNGESMLGTVTQLELAADVEVGTDVYRLLAAGSLLYVATNRPGAELAVFDISTPESPVEIGSAPTAGTPYGLDLVGTRLYVTTLTGGDDLEIFDVSDPTSPTKLGGIPAADTAYRVRVRDNRAYVSSAFNGDDVEIFDVGNPAAPTKLGGLDLLSGYYVRGLDVAYPYVYAGGSKMTVIDVSNPALPTPVGEGSFYWYAYDLQVAGARVIGLDSNNSNAPQLRLWDVATPSAPTMLGMADIWDSYGRDVEVVGDYAFTVCAPGGYSWGSELEVWNVAGATDPTLVTSLHLVHDGYAVAISGTHIYIGTNVSGDAELLVARAL